MGPMGQQSKPTRSPQGRATAPMLGGLAELVLVGVHEPKASSYMSFVPALYSLFRLPSTYAVLHEAGTYPARTPAQRAVLYSNGSAC
jgi:hypothetical protein